MSQKKAGIVIGYLTMGFNIVVGLLYTPFMLQKLGDSQYGVYVLCSSLVSFITLLDLGLGQTLVRYISKARSLGNKEDEAKLNGLFLTLYAAISLIAIIVGVLIVSIYPNICRQNLSAEEISLFRIIFIILLINTAISFPMCIFSSTINAYERFFFLKIVNFMVTLIKYATMTLLLIHGNKLISISVAIVAFSILMQMIYVVYCVRVLKIRFSFEKFDKAVMDEIYWFSFFIFLNLIIDFLYSNTDKLILGAVRGTFAVTVYSFGIYFQTYFQEISTTMSSMFLPNIVHLYEKEKDMDAISNTFLKVGRFQMAVLVLALGGFVVLGKDFIRLWIGNTYWETYYIGLLIMLPSLIPLTQNIGISVLRAMNMHKYRSYMYLVIAILNVAISVPLGIVAGGIGTAVGTALSCIAGQIVYMNWFYARRIGIDIKSYWNNLGKFIVICIPEMMVVLLLKMVYPIKSWWIFIIYVILFSGMYGALYWKYVSNLYEKDTIKSMVFRLFGRIKLS